MRRASNVVIRHLNDGSCARSLHEMRCASAQDACLHDEKATITIMKTRAHTWISNALGMVLAPVRDTAGDAAALSSCGVLLRLGFMMPFGFMVFLRLPVDMAASSA